MHVVFVDRESGPEKLLCEAEIIFDADDGALGGMKLVGFSIWRGPEGEPYVSFPARPFGAGTERKYFDYLRSADGVIASSRRVRNWILDEYRAARAA
jgi:hypothetical protein